MMIEEFTARTGYKPTPDEYAKIERDYSAFDGDKQEFCDAWALNKALEKVSFGLKNDIVLGLNCILRGMYQKGYKDTKHYRKLRNIILSIDF